MNTAVRAPGRPRDQRASMAIQQAALEQLSSIGYAALTMERVAGVAGVSRATVYRRYRDKADLVTAAIAAKAVGDLPAGPSEDPRADLVRFLNEFDERFANSCVSVLGALLGAHEEPHALELHRQRVIGPRTGFARSLLRQAQLAGDLDPAADLDLAVQMLVGSVLARQVSGDRARSGWAERSVAAIWRGLSPGPAEPRPVPRPG